ncbi:MAG: hypothetical protein P9E67_05030, partial [Candidatus Competibacter sp.]|nr:hypothetical protein [Candidatus Competibacter sp.]
MERKPLIWSSNCWPCPGLDAAPGVGTVEPVALRALAKAAIADARNLDLGLLPDDIVMGNNFHNFLSDEMID